MLLWPPRDDSEKPMALVRDDSHAAVLGDPHARWHAPNTDRSATWADTCEAAEASGCPIGEAVLLLPGWEQIGEHLVWLATGACQHCPAVFELSVELPRLRARVREAGGG
jgi:hypothetical protein